MYVDLIILIVFLVLIVVYSKRFQTYIFGLGMTDIFFRILEFLKNNIPIKGIKGELSKYVPSSIPNIINKYTDGTISLLLVWAYVIVMIIFLYFIAVIFFKRKKIS